jgi:SSS family solute:Na+ symporter
MMIVLTLAAFVIIAAKSGGFVQANLKAFETAPALFARPGLDGSLLPGVWIGYLLLWLFADPMFPQIFQRFMAARDGRALATTAVLYPLVTAFLFFLTVSIGVMGRATLPGLTAAQSDNVLPLLLQRHVGGALGVLLLTGGMAALMSTLDSQLLTLSSMIALDFRVAPRTGALAGKLTLVALGAAGFAIAMSPPLTILDFINRTSFYGYAALAPVVIGGLYWKRGTRTGAFAAILAGEAVVVATQLNVVRWPGVLPAIPVLAASIAAYIGGSLLTTDRGAAAALARGPHAGAWPWAVAFAALFALGNDFWAWGRKPVLALGLPLWVWYSAGLCVLLSFAFAAYARARSGRR